MAKQKPTPRYRLTDLRIDKISLVDTPAVPKSVFVIAKRRDENDAPATATQPDSAVADQLATISKRLDAMSERIDALSVSPPPQETTDETALFELAKRVESFELAFRRVTGILPPDEQED